MISFISEPGVITHAGAVPTIILGERDNRRSDRVQGLADVLTGAGIAAEAAPDIDVAVWTKLLFVASTGGVGAVARSPFGMLRSLPETHRMLELVMDEIRSVAVARGVAMPDDSVAKALVFVDGLPESGETSLQRDIIAGRPGLNRGTNIFRIITPVTKRT